MWAKRPAGPPGAGRNPSPHHDNYPRTARWSSDLSNVGYPTVLVGIVLVCVVLYRRLREPVGCRPLHIDSRYGLGKNEWLSVYG